MTIRERAQLVIDPDGADEIVVDVNGDYVYPTRASSSAVSFPVTLTEATTYYVPTDPPSTITVSIKVNGLELGQHVAHPIVLDRDNTWTVKPQFHKAYKTVFENTDIYLGDPAVGSTTAVLAATTDTGEEVVITEGLSNPDVPRVITATAGGTGADIKAIQVTIDGTDADGNALTETLPGFTVNSTGTVTGGKAFATVTSVTIPAHDGTGATTAIGTGAALGMPRTMARNNVVFAYLDNVREGTAPTVATSASTLSLNTVTLDSTLDGSPVHIAVA